jgi:hypothetical protein
MEAQSVQFKGFRRDGASDAHRNGDDHKGSEQHGLEHRSFHVPRPTAPLAGDGGNDATKSGQSTDEASVFRSASGNPGGMETREKSGDSQNSSQFDSERTLNRASDADCLPFHTRVVCSRLEARVQVDLLESVSSVVRIF